MRSLSQSALPKVATLSLAAAAWLGVVAAVGADDAPSKPVELFNGKNFSGWVQQGGKANYRIEKGEIIGSTVPNTSNSFLCTDRYYADFILELEFKVQDGMNSGIQIRSHYFDHPTTVVAGEKTIKIGAGRVHGYQVEIDPSERAWTGGIYDEGRRGWLNDLKNNEPARQAFKHNEWNAFRVECRGNSIKTWLNGVPAADLNDTMTPAGVIALQVHSVGKRTDPMEIRWRKIVIRELK